MVIRMEYARDGLRCEIDRMGDCLWRVWVSNGTRYDTVFRKSLTSAQSTARTFIQTGTFPR